MVQNPHNVAKSNAQVTSNLDPRTPCQQSTHAQAGTHQVGHARYSVTEPGAIVMQRPGLQHRLRFNRDDFPVVDVVVAPALGVKLRQQQIEGIRWLYSRLLRFSLDDKSRVRDDGMGALLMGAPGCGKKVQVIALVQTLLTQSCYRPLAEPGGTVGRVLIVCASTSISTWEAEFRRWSSSAEMRAVVATRNVQSQVTAYLHNSHRAALIMTYEQIAQHISLLTQDQPPVDLLICDQGHGLEQQSRGSRQLLQRLQATRTLVLLADAALSLRETHSLVSFVTPHILPAYDRFKRITEDVIHAGERLDATADKIRLAELRSAEFKRIVDSMLLQQHAELLPSLSTPSASATSVPPPMILEEDVNSSRSQSIANVPPPMILEEDVNSSRSQSIANAPANTERKGLAPPTFTPTPPRSALTARRPTRPTSSSALIVSQPSQELQSSPTIETAGSLPRSSILSSSTLSARSETSKQAAKRIAREYKEAHRTRVACKYSRTAIKKVRSAYGLEDKRDDRGGKRGRKAKPLNKFAGTSKPRRR